MLKHHQKQYIKRALINSLLAVLSAVIAVLIVVYGYQAVQVVVDRMMSNDGVESMDEEQFSQIELLEELRGPEIDSTPEDREELDNLRVPEDSNASEEEYLQSLESLRQPE